MWSARERVWAGRAPRGASLTALCQAPGDGVRIHSNGYSAGSSRRPPAGRPINPVDGHLARAVVPRGTFTFWQIADGPFWTVGPVRNTLMPRLRDGSGAGEMGGGGCLIGGE